MTMADLFAGHVPLLRPWLGEDEVKAAAEVILSGWVSQGPRVAGFEKAVASYVGAKHGIATNACTSALHLALRLKGVGPGDDVICPSFTCMATANAIHGAGARPVFAEIDARTYNLDPALVEQAITPRAKAILVVHQIGLAADVRPIAAIAERYGLVVVEDGACSLGATYEGKHVGSIAAPTCFSFHPRKVITTGEGGMITTDDDLLAERARILRSTGASVSDLERHMAKGVLVQQYSDFGYNYRMTDIQAAIGLVQMGKLRAILEERKRQARSYDDALSDVPEIDCPAVPAYATHAYSSYLIRLRPASRVSRDGLLRAMAERGISCRVGIQPLHHEPYYRQRFRDLRLPVTEDAARTTLFLPIYPGLTQDQQASVVAAIKDSLA